MSSALAATHVRFLWFARLLGMVRNISKYPQVSCSSHWVCEVLAFVQQHCMAALAS
jgi:hypothetical protein